MSINLCVAPQLNSTLDLFYFPALDKTKPAWTRTPDPYWVPLLPCRLGHAAPGPPSATGARPLGVGAERKRPLVVRLKKGKEKIYLDGRKGVKKENYSDK